LELKPRFPGRYHGQRIEYTSCEYDPDPENGPGTDGPQQEPDENRNNYWERRKQWYRQTWQLVLPEPLGPFAPLPEPAKFNLKGRYAKRGLQIIVKLANIKPTPEKPEYKGGSWHVEGQMVSLSSEFPIEVSEKQSLQNEHIVTTSHYYHHLNALLPAIY